MGAKLKMYGLFAVGVLVVLVVYKKFVPATVQAKLGV
jgi:hypothetical protein